MAIKKSFAISELENSTINCYIAIINFIGSLVIKTLMKTFLIIPVKPLSQTFFWLYMIGSGKNKSQVRLP